MNYDIAIIGGGPAGLSAAINAYARNKSVIVFGRTMETSAIWKAEKINNHLGMPNITGSDMLTDFYAHAKALHIEIKTGRVDQVLPMGEQYMINCNNEFYEAKTVIIATGVSKGKKIVGEEAFIGKGVSYCATCDGMLYRGKDVFILAETEEGEEDVTFLSEVCNKVYYLPAFKTEKHYEGASNVQVLSGKASEVLGDDFVIGVKVGDTVISCEGAFFMKASVPLDSLVFGLKVENNAIEVSKNMETNLPGIFACGDCTGWPFQVSNAVGEGLVAAQQAARYLTKKNTQ